VFFVLKREDVRFTAICLLEACVGQGFSHALIWGTAAPGSPRSFFFFLAVLQFELRVLCFVRQALYHLSHAFQHSFGLVIF
jgi:hypothetical protein